MRPQVRWSLAVLLAGSLAVPVLGQPMRIDVVDRLQQGVETPFLLASSSVRKEIKMSDEQTQKISRIVQESYKKFPRQPLKGSQEAREKVNKAIPDVLRAEQVKRLEQIKWQVNGLIPFIQPEVQQKLKLTDKQKQEMQAIADDLKEQVRKSVHSASNLKERFEAMGKIPQMRKEAVEKADVLLSDEQKKTWKEMMGEAFEFPFDMLRSSLMP